MEIGQYYARKFREASVGLIIERFGYYTILELILKIQGIVTFKNF